MSKHDDQAQLAKGKVQVGDSAPDFTLPDQSGVPVSLGHFLGKTDIVLYFSREITRLSAPPKPLPFGTATNSSNKLGRKSSASVRTL